MYWRGGGPPASKIDPPERRSRPAQTVADVWVHEVAVEDELGG